MLGVWNMDPNFKSIGDKIKIISHSHCVSFYLFIQTALLKMKLSISVSCTLWNSQKWPNMALLLQLSSVGRKASVFFLFFFFSFSVSHTPMSLPKEWHVEQTHLMSFDPCMWTRPTRCFAPNSSHLSTRSLRQT